MASSPERLLREHGWYEWLCHTNFSFLVGASHPHECLQRAAALGYAGLAVTDFDGAYGLARAHRDRQRLVDAPPRLFYGAEIHLAVDHDLPIIFQDTLALVPRSRTGYRNLCALLTHAHRGGKADANVPLADLLAKPVDDLVAIQPMRGLVRRPAGDGGAWERRCAAIADHFGGRFYFAVSRHLNPSEDCWIQPTLTLAARLGRPCLLSQDAFFHEPAQKDMSDLLHAIRTNRSLDTAVDHMFVNTERCLHSLAGIARRFGELPVYEAALCASRDLADSCRFDFSELSYKYPKEMIPDGLEAQDYLETLTWKAARDRYGSPVPDRVARVLTHELGLIRHLGFADYFLTVWDIVRWARSQDILCQGRGSAANSAVCYVLGVTSVDPALFDLLFERFLSVERGDPPDIDVDFEHERREEVIQYIYQRYGRGKAAMVANVITFRRRGALRAVGKALGVPDAMLGEAAKLLEARYFRGNSSDVVLDRLRDDMAEDEAPDMPDVERARNRAVDTPIIERVSPADAPRDAPSWDIWSAMAERLRGFPRHLGIHSGGFMLSDQPLDCLVPQEPATMEGRTIVQWCKEDIEGLGFFKIDILALGMLTAIRKSFQAIEAGYGRQLTLAAIPTGDVPTYDMICRADTVGTFQIESRAQMSMLPRLRPRTFYDLVVEVAIIRPGPIQGGMIHPYLRRRDKKEIVSYPDERLRPILERTLGIPIFQEQVMRIAMAVGNFTPGEANELRRNMGAWSMKGDIGPLLGKLAEGMRANGIAEEFVQGILGQMKGFADYGFPESHAVSFALLAYASSYLKKHYPAVFFMSLLNSQPMGFYSPHALVQAAQRDGVQVLPICVNASGWDCSLESVGAAGGAPPYGIRLGLRYVHGLRRSGADALLAARGALGGRFADVPQILARAGLYRNDLTALAAANALQVLGASRKAAIWLAEAAPFCPAIEDVEEAPACVDVPESTMERIERDFAATSSSLGPHPALVIRKEHWCYAAPEGRVLRAQDLAGTAQGRVVTVFGMVLVRQSPPSAGGMVFLTLEDETGFINLVFTPPAYARLYRLVESQAFLCARGRLQRQNESHSLMVSELLPPTVQRADVLSFPEAQELEDHANGITARELQVTRNYM